MSVKIDEPSEVGEYDPGMQTLLQLLWGEGFCPPAVPPRSRTCSRGATSRTAVCST